MVGPRVTTTLSTRTETGSLVGVETIREEMVDRIVDIIRARVVGVGCGGWTETTTAVAVLVVVVAGERVDEDMTVLETETSTNA